MAQDAGESGVTRSVLLAGLLAVTAVSGPARAAPAPLPPGWTSQGSEGQEDYHAPPPLRGLYGHGFSGPFNAACEGDEAAKAAFTARAPRFGTEFWFYTTGAQAVMLERSVVLEAPQPCARPLRYSYGSSRGFIVDGLIQSLTQGEDGDVTMMESRPLGRRDGEYSGEFSPIANLMARPETPHARVSHRRRIAGLPALCFSNPGIVWSTVCVSGAAGRSYNMIVETGAGDDERQMFGMEFDTIDANATIDGRLFELQRSWRGPR